MKKHLTKVKIDNEVYLLNQADKKVITHLLEKLNVKINEDDLIPSHEVLKKLNPLNLPSWSICLRGARGKENLSQKELSEKSGIPITTISKYENAQLRISERAAKKLAKALKVKSHKVFIDQKKKAAKGSL